MIVEDSIVEPITTDLAPGRAAHEVWKAEGTAMVPTTWLDLGDGDAVELHAGDTVVQQGARHAWRNHGDEPCVIVGTLVGAVRARQ